MSSLAKDPHSFCIRCRGVDCDENRRCLECQGWSESLINVYLSDRLLKRRQERYRVRQRGSKESVAPLYPKPIIQNKAAIIDNVSVDDASCFC